MLDSSDKCPAQNMMAVGGAGRERNENVKSWEECSDCCRKKSDCKYWTWNKPQSVCVTMTNARSVKQKKNVWSGVRECGGDYLLIIILSRSKVPSAQVSIHFDNILSRIIIIIF